MKVARHCLLLVVCLWLSGCVREPEPTPEYAQLHRDLAGFTGLGAVSVTPIDTNQYRSRFRATIRHGGAGRDEALDALETYLTAEASWFDFKRTNHYWFIRTFGGTRYHFDIRWGYDAREITLDVRQSFGR